MRVIGLFLSIFFLSGCLVRTYTLEKPRVDTRIAGNQGYLFGTPGPDDIKKETRLGQKRKLSVMEIELGSSKYAKKNKKDQQEPDDFSAGDLDLDDSSMEMEDIDLLPSAPEEVIAQNDRFQWYTVQKDETLQKISHKFYNTTKKWRMIFDYNKNILKNPDRIYPGTKIKIPVLK